MTFMDSLANNPGGSGIYGQPRQTSDQDVLGIVNQLRDRDMQDFKNKANFMSDLSLKQDKMRALFDPNKLGLQDNKQLNVVQASDPNLMQAHDQSEITPIQKADIGLKQQGITLEGKKLDERNRLAQSALDIKQQQADINQQKSDQIHEQKQADLQRKIDEADSKLSLAQQVLNSRNTNAEQSLQAHKDLAAAMEERHKLELAQKDAQFKRVSDQHQQQIDDLNEKIKQGSKTKTTTELNPDGTKKTVTTERGDSGDMIQVTGKDGNSYMIPKNKLDDWNANHKPEGQDEEE